MKTLATFKPVVISQASGNTIWASGLVVMTTEKASIKSSVFSANFFPLFFSFFIILNEVYIIIIRN
jgi:hypothetical protein